MLAQLATAQAIAAASSAPRSGHFGGTSGNASSTSGLGSGRGAGHTSTSGLGSKVGSPRMGGSGAAVAVGPNANAVTVGVVSPRGGGGGGGSVGHSTYTSPRAPVAHHDPVFASSTSLPTSSSLLSSGSMGFPVVASASSSDFADHSGELAAPLHSSRDLKPNTNKTEALHQLRTQLQTSPRLKYVFILFGIVELHLLCFVVSVASVSFPKSWSF
jgi:hypothetical protein